MTFACLAVVAHLVAVATASNSADGLSDVRAAENARIEVMTRAAKSVVCIMEPNGAGGGSGVVITPDGVGVTNYHVIAGMLETRKSVGGMYDGKLYPLQVLGIDPTGDLAMFRLSSASPSRPPPADEGATRPADKTPLSDGRGSDGLAQRAVFVPAPLGDSDTVHMGDWVFAMGNPFLLAEDYTPTVTHGIVSGMHRYQFGADGRSLVYTDCIQVDASINPGNSGGPLFDMNGHLIGINGRASFEQRGRVNVGLGYAITINQIKRFMPGLRAGLLVEHGSLGATTIDLGFHRVVFERMLEPSVASAAGIEVGDRLVEFAGREIHSSNQFANALGVFPAGWPVQLVFEHEGKSITRMIRLERLPASLRGTFDVDEKLNRAEVERVLKECQAVLGKLPIGGSLHWRALRQSVDAQQPATIEKNTLEFNESPDGQGQCRVMNAGGKLLRTYEYNGRTAQVQIADKPATDAAAQDASRLNLWMAARRAIYSPMTSDTLSHWKHTGGDEYNARVVDLLEYTPSAGNGVCVAIDPATHEPVRAFWKSIDAPTAKNPAIEIEMEEYRMTDGVRLPMQFRTFIGGEPGMIDRVTSYQVEKKP